ncbi:MAG: DUF4282 domain-containing protein [Actinobacteria bacterium]|nr:DUF4282 domain-containing protein [Actinomycetota bacterium]
MFYNLNVRSKYLLMLTIILLVPYLFRTATSFDSYYGYYGVRSGGGLSAISFIFIFAALIARSEYVHRSLLALSGVWAIANFIPVRFSEWSNGNFESLFAVLLYVGGLVTLGAVLNAEKAFGNSQFTAYFNRIVRSQNKVFSAVWAVLTALAALFFAWATYTYNSEASLNSVIKVLAVFITVVAVFDFIHRFFDEKSNAIFSFVKQLDDFSLNSYLTRRISSWIYGFIHTYILLGSLYLVPYFLSNTFSTWGLILGFPVLAPLAIAVAYLFIMIIRLVFEYSNALVHIAENTSKQ